MAVVRIHQANFAVNFNALNLYWHWANVVDSDLENGVNFPFNGKVYPDIAWIRGSQGGEWSEITVGGYGLTSNGTALTGGRITGLIEEDGGGTVFTIEGIDIAATLFQAALQSSSNADDRSLLEEALRGDDQIYLADGADVAYGFNGDDLIVAYGGNDTLYGGAGDDQLYGGAGDDTMYGGTGDDFFEVRNAGDVVIEYGGEGDFDVVFSYITYILPQHVEELYLANAGGAINGTGNELDNWIEGNNANNSLYGLGGDDTLWGGTAGLDTLYGGTGDDTYYIRTTTAQVVELEGEGDDLVFASINYTLPDHVEELALEGTATTGTGNSLDNHIAGNALNNTLSGLGGADTLKGFAGDDTLDGGLGADIMEGGIGNDTYHVDNSGDQVIELANAGYDTVISTISHTLSANVEELRLGGTAAIDGTGNALNNIILGNLSDNVIHGANGRDELTGNLGSDRFEFHGAAQSAAGDLITDLNTGVQQTMRFDREPGFLTDGNLDFMEFLTASGAVYDFIASSRFTASGRAELAFQWDTAQNRTRILLDENGDGQQDGFVEIDGVFVIKEVAAGSGRYYGVEVERNAEIIYLDFDNPARAPFFTNSGIESWHTGFHGDPSNFVNDLEMQAQIVLETQRIFNNSGIPILVTSLQPDSATLARSTTVKFSAATTQDFNDRWVYRVGGSLLKDPRLGEAYDGVDRFNTDKANEVGVFFDRDVIKLLPDGTTETLRATPAGVAEVIAHEAAHAWGLRHVDAEPNAGTDVMDYDWSSFGYQVFSTQPLPIFDYPAVAIYHNNTYHLFRYVLGYSDAEIAAGLGLTPGHWENPALSEIVFRLQVSGNAIKKLVLGLTGSGADGEGFRISDEPVTVAPDGSVTLRVPATGNFVILGYGPDDTDLPSFVLGFGTGPASQTTIEGGMSMPVNGMFYALNDNGTTGTQVGSFTATVDTSNGMTKAGTDAADSLTGTALADALFGLAGNDVIVGGAGDDLLDGGDGDDTLEPGTGNDRVYGGSGNDAIFFGSSFTAADTVDGGAGDNDQIGLQGNYTGANALTLGVNTIRDVEVIGLLGGAGNGYSITTVDANVGAGQILTLFGTNLAAGNGFTFNGSAETDGAFRIYGGAGTDELTGGGGNDGFWFGPGRFDPATDRVDGGGGNNDQLALDGDYTITLDGTAIRNVETITLQAGPAGDRNSFDITVADSLVGAGQQVTIFGLLAVNAIRIDATAELDGSVRVFGGQSHDTIYGSAGDDRIFGGNGSDFLYGGAGNDTYVYDAVSQSTGLQHDGIHLTAGDRIDFNFTVGGIATTVIGGTLSGDFDADPGAAIGAGQMGAGEAVLFRPGAGVYGGQSFLIVDANGVAGYQAGEDYVIQLLGSPTTLPPDPFV